MIELRMVNSRLAEAGLNNPVLSVLTPDGNSYSALFLQRKATITASAASINNEDAELAHQECMQFFRCAVDKSAQLAVVPEYCCPWDSLIAATNEQITPSNGAIWVVGCESITLAELDNIRSNALPGVAIIYDAPDAGTKQFLDPVAFVFQSTRNTGEAVVVILVQFKTAPMADPHGRLEPDNLICGRILYRFQNEAEQSIRMITLLCSDALALANPENHQVNGEIGQISPLLLLHLQLNAKPRDIVYTQYRYRLLQNQMEREIFVANWAAGTKIRESGNIIDIPEGMSALFFQSDDLRCDEQRFASNHKHGAYPTYIGSCRSYAYFFNFESLLFYFRSTKVSQISALAHERARTGLEMLQTMRFDIASGQWADISEAPDMCDVVFATLPDYISHGRNQPINTERLMLLCCGKITAMPDTPRKARWPQIQTMESCRLTDTEAIRRLTFGQDQSDGASSYRSALIAQFTVFEALRADPTSYPTKLEDFKIGSALAFDPDSPFTNVQNGDDRRAFIAYLGADIPDESIPGRVYETVTRHLSVRGDADMDKILLWYRDLEANLKRYPETQAPTLTRDTTESPVSISCVQQ
jgi:hypothetical protein